MGVSFDPSRVRRKGQASLDTSFFTQKPMETVQEIRIDQIDSWTAGDGQGQPFHLYSAEKLSDMAQNIRENGVLNPCIVRPKDGRYQLLAGHNRTAAARLAGLEVIPCMVKDVDDDTAALYMIDSNLYQREQILPSERAAAYAMKLAIYRRRGKRTDLTGERSVDAAQRVAEEAGDSARSVQRYARLTRLTPELLELVDEGKIPVTVGSEIAGLNGCDQGNVCRAMRETGKSRLSMSHAEEIRAAVEQDGGLSEEAACEILMGDRAKPDTRMQKVSIPAGDISDKVWKKLKKEPTLQQLLLETVKRYLEAGRIKEEPEK